MHGIEVIRRMNQEAEAQAEEGEAGVTLKPTEITGSQGLSFEAREHLAKARADTRDPCPSCGGRMSSRLIEVGQGRGWLLTVECEQCDYRRVLLPRKGD